MNEVYQEDKPLPYVTMTAKQAAQVIVLGLIVGLLTYGLSYLFEMAILRSVPCEGDTAVICASATSYANAAASIVASGIGLFGLVKLQAFRPLLIVLAVAMSLWKMMEVVGTLPKYGMVIAGGVLYAMAYIVFAWIARVRLFWPAVILMLILVIVIRFILTS